MTELRAVMSRLAAGVSVVTGRSGRHDLAVVATSVVSCSLDPPMVLFTVHRESRLREVVEPEMPWAVSVLGERGLQAARWLAEPGRPLLDQLASIPHRRRPGSGLAILDTSVAWVEARTVWIKEAGSHDVVVGEVLDCGLTPGGHGSVLHVRGVMEPYS